MRIRREKDFFSCFDEKTGRYLRSGIIRDGKDTGEDPFMASFPELLDVGIMGHCIHGKAGLCLAAGVECYQDGLHTDRPNMSLADFRRLATECAGRTYQFALGGCGDPDQHEHFAEILQTCRECRIVPNFTTSGLGMTPQLAALCKEYCGAVAVSWYRSGYTLDAIRMLLDAGVKTNIHYVLTKDSVGEALQRLDHKGFPEGVNSVIFLLHKPVGLGTRTMMVPPDDHAFQELLRHAGSAGVHYKIGFDSCTVPALINNPGRTDLDSLDTCEGGRWSAYITADMQMLPCSFDNQKKRWAVDLKSHTVKEAWDSTAFENFRSCFRTSCPECPKRSLCMGGCPVCPEVVPCQRPERGR